MVGVKNIGFAGTSLKRLLIIGACTLAACYVAVLAVMVVAQRSLFYAPSGAAHAPPADLRGVREIHLSTSDGERLRAWYKPPGPARPLILMFHGVGGNLDGCIGAFHVLTAGGDGMLAVEYRGYPGSTGTPTEAGLLRDGETAYAFARAQGVATRQIAVLGSSLGSGVAVAVAANHQIGALVLDSPFSSAADVAADRYWMFPVRWVMLDSYRSDLRIGGVRTPLLIVHGDRDGTIPIRFARRLFALARPPKRFITIAGGGHVAMGAVPDEVQSWIDRNAGG